MTEQGASRVADQYSPRERLAAMIARAELDPDGFGQELRDDPAAALQRAGFSDTEAQGLRSLDQRADDPAAALRAGCADTTCYISICPSSCFVTIPALPGLCNGGGGGGGGGCRIFSIF